MKIQKLFAMLLVFIFITGFFILVSKGFLVARADNYLSELLLSYPKNKKSVPYEYLSESRGISFVLDTMDEVKKYSGEVYKDFAEDVIEISKFNEVSNSSNKIRIIAVDASTSSDSLNLLERFIFTNHGITEKADQITYKLKNYEVSQIAFDFDVEGKVYYEIYSALKFNDLGWIVTTEFELNSTVPEVLNRDVPSINELNDLIKSIKLLNPNQINKSKFIELNKDFEIHNEIININRKTNSKFRFTF